MATAWTARCGRPARATTELHRDFTVSWQTMLARGIAVVGPSIRIDLDAQIVEKA